MDDSEQYLLERYRYIELNPVRAKMVDGPGEYPWSSYKINALGLESVLYTPHESYLALGRNPMKRQQAYQALFRYHVDSEFLESIRAATNRNKRGQHRFFNRGFSVGSELLKMKSKHCAVVWFELSLWGDQKWLEIQADPNFALSSLTAL